MPESPDPIVDSIELAIAEMLEDELHLPPESVFVRNQLLELFELAYMQERMAVSSESSGNEDVIERHTKITARLAAQVLSHDLSLDREAVVQRIMNLILVVVMSRDEDEDDDGDEKEELL